MTCMMVKCNAVLEDAADAMTPARLGIGGLRRMLTLEQRKTRTEDSYGMHLIQSKLEEA